MKAGALRGMIEPFYFGTSGGSLFGCYHVPQPGSARECAVLLCYPIGEEYIRFHRAYARLAGGLAGLGFPVLRFDYRGCGDSSGESGQGHVAQWLLDTAAAIDELRRKSKAARVCVVGLRLGATLAVLAAAERADIDSMVLWDAVINGRDHIAELKALHRQMLSYAHVTPKRGAPDGGHREVLGFPLSDALVADLENVDLLTAQRKPANQILIVHSHEQLSQRQLRTQMESLGANVTYRELLNPNIWLWIEDVAKVLVPHHILQSIASWVADVYR